MTAGMDGEAPDSARQWLEFFVAAGVDLPIGEVPIDRLAAPIPHAAPPSPPSSAPSPSEAGQSPAKARGEAPRAPALNLAAQGPEEGARRARLLAKDAPDLAALESLLRAFDGCALKNTASRLVFADGTPGAKLMIVGEAPGREEDEIGRPFVGRAGQLLDKMLAAIGLDRQQTYIANVVPWRPPGNRTPTPQEIAICLPFLMRQIELASPRLLLTLGAPASQTLLGQKDGILRLRGRWFDFPLGSGTIPALASLHPAYLLRQSAHKALAWRDFRALRTKLAAL